MDRAAGSANARRSLSVSARSRLFASTCRHREIDQPAVFQMARLSTYAVGSLILQSTEAHFARAGESLFHLCALN